MPRHPSRPRPWSPLTDAEYAALEPFIHKPGAGRPIRDPRGRLDAIFRIVTTRIPWSRVTTDHGRTDTIHRQFRRWAHAGLWSTLLRQVARRRCPKPLRALRDRVAAAYRRAIRILGLPGVVLARRLNLPRALPGPPWYFPNPDLSETIRKVFLDAIRAPDSPDRTALMRACRAVLRVADRWRPVPACLVPLG